MAKSDGGSKTADAPHTSDLRPQTSDLKPQTSNKPKAKTQPSKGKLQYVTYEKQKTNKTTGKPYAVTHAKIMGFAATDEAYQRGVELHGSASGEMVDGVKVLGLYFSHRYAASAKDVCDALNDGKPFAECKAIIDNATEERAAKREEWKQKREERKAAIEREQNGTRSSSSEREQARPKVKAQTSAVSRQPSTEKTYTQTELAEWLRKLNAGDPKAAKFFNDLAKAA